MRLRSLCAGHAWNSCGGCVCSVCAVAVAHPRTATPAAAHDPFHQAIARQVAALYDVHDKVFTVDKAEKQVRVAPM